MGMFDTIRCDYPIPVTKEIIDTGLDMHDISFQTKDLENFMEEYFINPEGELFFIHNERVWRDDDDVFFKGYMEIVKTEIRPANFHGVIYFYCYEDLPETEDGKRYILSVDYEAKFVDNKLISLNLHDQEIIDDTEHYHETQEFFRQCEIEKNKWYNKYFLLTKPILKVRRSIYRFFYNLHNLTGRLHTWSVRNI